MAVRRSFLHRCLFDGLDDHVQLGIQSLQVLIFLVQLPFERQYVVILLFDGAAVEPHLAPDVLHLLSADPHLCVQLFVLSLNVIHLSRECHQSPNILLLFPGVMLLRREFAKEFFEDSFVRQGEKSVVVELFGCGALVKGLILGVDAIAERSRSFEIWEVR